MAESQGPRREDRALDRLRAAAADLHHGEAVALVVVVAYVLFVGIAAATAPPIDVGQVSNGSDVLVGVQGPFKDAEGYAVIRGPDTSTTWASQEAWAHFDVDRLENGNVLAGFMIRSQKDCGPYDPPCARTGFRIYDPDAADPVVREWTMPVRSHVNSEVHDATMLPSGDIAISDMEHERIAVVDEDGEVVWQWNASSFYEAPADPTTRDWLHINDLDYLGDDRFLVSVRNANQVLVVERGAGVVEVINEDTDDANDAACTEPGQLVDRDGDGDVRCGDPEVMDHQHNPQWYAEDAVMVADSENDRVVDLRRNGDGEWGIEWQLSRAGGVGLRWPRDADVLPSGTLLVTDSLNNRVFEVARNGTVVWSTSTRPIPYEADLNGTEYHDDPSNGSTGAEEQGAVESGRDGLVPAPVEKAYNGAVGLFSLPYWFRMGHFVGLFVTVVAVLGGVGSAVYHRLLGGRLPFR